MKHTFSEAIEIIVAYPELLTDKDKKALMKSIKIAEELQQKSK
jgi:hypothetical protein